MNRGQDTTGGKLTFVVFKDSDESRTLQLPLKWVSWASALAGLSLLVTLGAVLVIVSSKIGGTRLAPSSAVRSTQQEPGLIQDSGTVAELRQKVAALEAQLKNGATTTESAPPPELLTPATAPADGIPTELQLSVFTPQVKPLPAGQEIPLELKAARATWEGNLLKAKFDLVYTSKDGGTQRGRILALARGPDELWVYPRGALSRKPEAPLLDPARGEPFALSRYRPSEVSFGPILPDRLIESVQFLIFNSEGGLLFSRVVAVPEHKP